MLVEVGAAAAAAAAAGASACRGCGSEARRPEAILLAPREVAVAAKESCTSSRKVFLLACLLLLALVLHAAFEPAKTLVSCKAAAWLVRT